MAPRRGRQSTRAPRQARPGRGLSLVSGIAQASSSSQDQDDGRAGESIPKRAKTHQEEDNHDDRFDGGLDIEDEVLPSIEKEDKTDASTADSNEEFELDIAALQQQFAAIAADLNPQEVQQIGQYNDVSDDEDEAPGIPEQDFDVAEEEAEAGRDTEDTVSPATLAPTPPTSTPSMLPPNTRRHPLAEDTSLPILHSRIYEEPNKFEMALGLWCEDVGVSREQYKSLREILLLLQQDPTAAGKLPKSIKTLKRHVNGQLPLLPMRKKEIPLLDDKLPTQSALAKKGDDKVPTETLFFFDAKKLFQAFLNSDLVAKMYFGMGQYHNNNSDTELWYSHAWRSSLRTTSGRYPHYPDGQPLFVSDFVTFSCPYDICDCKIGGNLHLGRVFSVGVNLRSDAAEFRQHNEVVLEVQEAHRFSDIPQHLLLAPSIEENEIILSRERFYYVIESSVSERVEVSLDYVYGDTKINVVPMIHQGLFVRRVIDDINTLDSRCTLLCHTAPLRAELELKQFTRQHFIDMDKSKCLSVPLLTFIDGFGLYRNNYRSLIGFYQIMANLTYQERHRRANVLPITLGPHGSNFADVVGALTALADLDEGYCMNINNPNLEGGLNEIINVCAHTMSYIADMPQQQSNSGGASVVANFGCRSCFVEEKDRGDLDFDIVSQGRFHHQAVQMRKEMDALRTKGEKEVYGKENGMNLAGVPLATISPALDWILTRPTDPAHSEYQGISKRMHEVMMADVFTPRAALAYGRFIRWVFPFPPGWHRLQSPNKHLGSYSLSEHARWSVIIPGLLRCWLKEEHIKPLLVAAIRNRQSRLDPAEYLSPVNFIVTCLAAMAKSNSQLMTNKAADDTVEVVFRGRKLYQDFMKVLIDAANRNTRLAPSRAVSRAGSRAGSRAPSQSRDSAALAADPTQSAQGAQTPAGHNMFGQVAAVRGPVLTAEEKQRAVQYAAAAARPVVHAVTHHPATIDEYGTTGHIEVLIGEDKHRYFKQVIYNTNHRDVEFALLQKENVRQTVRLVLANSFRAAEDAAVTKILQELNNDCASLLTSLLPRSEQEAYKPDGEENEDQMDIQADDKHLRPLAIGSIPTKHCKETLKFPTRASNLSAGFTSALRNAYKFDYGRPDIMNFGNKAMLWSKKLSYTDIVIEQRVAFAVGDFVEVASRSKVPGASSTRIVRIDGIFAHKLHGKERLFTKVTEVIQTDIRDRILDLPLLRLADNPDDDMIVGLPSIYSKRIYIIPVKLDFNGITGLGESDAVDFVLIDWEVKFL